MARLPTLRGDRGAVLQQSPSMLSAADVASPYRSIAGAFSDVGGQAYDAAIALERAAQTAMVAGERSGALNFATTLSTQVNGDAAAFKSGYETWAKQRVAQTDPRFQAIVARELGEVGDGQWRSLSEQSFNRSVRTTEASLVSSIGALDDEAAAAARTFGLDSPEYLAARGRMRDLYGELGGNPLFEVTPEMADNELRRRESRHGAEAMVGLADRIYATDPTQAAKLADEILNSQELLLGQDERQAYAGQITRRLSALDTQREAAVKGLLDQASDMARILREDPARANSPEVAALRSQLIASGTVAGARAATGLINAEADAFVIGNFLRLPDVDQIAFANQMARGGNAITRVDRIISIESGGNANAANPNSTAVGAGQFTSGTWLAMVRKYRPELAAGKSAADILALRTDGDLSREMTGHYAEENAAYLAARGHAATDGNVYLAHFLGPGGAAAVLGADPGRAVSAILPEAVINANRSILEGKTAGEVVAWAARKMGDASAVVYNPADRPEVVEAVRTRVTDLSADLLTELKTNFGSLYRPANTDIARLVDGLAAVNDPDLRNGIADLLQQVAQADATGVQLIQRLRDGQDSQGIDGYTATQVRIRRSYEDQRADTLKRLTDDPVGYAEDIGLIAPTPIDLTSEATSTATLRQRAADAVAIADRFGRTPVFFRPEERTAFQTVAAAGGPQLITLADTIVAAAGDHAPAMLAELFDGAPSLAHIGGLIESGADNATIVDAARGFQLRKMEGYENRAPNATQRNPLIQATIGSAFSANAQAETAVVDTANAIYEARAQARGIIAWDPNVSPPIYEQALQEAAGARFVNGKQFGGLGTWQGRQIVLPNWVEPGEFGDMIARIDEPLLAEAGAPSANGMAFRPSDIRQGTFVSIGPGQYAVALGDIEGGDPRWIPGNGPGGRWILDIDAMHAGLISRPPPVEEPIPQGIIPPVNTPPADTAGLNPRSTGEQQWADLPAADRERQFYALQPEQQIAIRERYPNIAWPDPVTPEFIQSMKAWVETNRSQNVPDDTLQVELDRYGLTFEELGL